MRLACASVSDDPWYIPRDVSCSWNVRMRGCPKDDLGHLEEALSLGWPWNPQNPPRRAGRGMGEREVWAPLLIPLSLWLFSREKEHETRWIAFFQHLDFLKIYLFSMQWPEYAAISNQKIITKSPHCFNYIQVVGKCSQLSRSKIILAWHNFRGFFRTEEASWPREWMSLEK